MIVLKNLSKKYRSSAVLDGVSASLPEGKITAFIGGNGAGKSTALNIISRLIPATSGTVEIDGVPLGAWKSRELAKRLTILSQNPFTPARLTVEELVEFGRFPHCNGRPGAEDRRMVEFAMECAGIADLRNRFLDELSGGQRQIAHIAMAVAQDTKYILLDEPLNNLDMNRAAKVMKLVRALARERGKSVVIVIHDINFVSFYADFVAAFKNGKLLYCGPADGAMSPWVLRGVYDMDIAVEERGGKKLCVYYE